MDIQSLWQESSKTMRAFGQSTLVGFLCCGIIPFTCSNCRWEFLRRKWCPSFWREKLLLCNKLIVTLRSMNTQTAGSEFTPADITHKKSRTARSGHRCFHLLDLLNPKPPFADSVFALPAVLFKFLRGPLWCGVHLSTLTSN